MYYYSLLFSPSSVITYFLSPASNQEEEWTQLLCGGRGREGDIYIEIQYNYDYFGIFTLSKTFGPGKLKGIAQKRYKQDKRGRIKRT